MIDAERLLNWHFPVVEQSYTATDTMLYALSIGLGSEPLDARQLRFVEENHGPIAFPTMAVVLGFPGSWMADPATGIDFASIVHGEEEVRFHRPLPAAGTVLAHHRVVEIVDKGPGRGAIITYDKVLIDKESGEQLATVRHTTFARGDGGFSQGGHGTPSRSVRPADPDRAPDRLFALRTLPQQALLYRLLADRNPLHSSPDVARKAGFERPILHGLCTFGMAAHAVLATFADYDPTRLCTLRARFSAPVLPGDALVVEMVDEQASIRFRVRNEATGQLVLTGGQASLSTG